MNTIKFKLKGLTCQACIKLSTNRIKKIPGVQDVKIDLNSGDTEVTSITDIDFDIIKQSLIGTNYNVTN